MSTNSASPSAHSAPQGADNIIPLPAAERAKMQQEFEERMRGDIRPVTVMTKAGLVTLTASQVAGNDEGHPQCLFPDCLNNEYKGYANVRSRASHFCRKHNGDWWQHHNGKRGNDHYEVL